jgi:glycosyltransferase involved in cell wall biosynthesis
MLSDPLVVSPQSSLSSSMNSRSPRISVGIPVYNGERYLAQAIECILAQTLKELELIISDNASSDRTAEICQYYAARDSRIRYCRSETNRGAAWNHNRVFKLSSGEYFKWQCHDDLCHLKFLEKCVSVLDREPAIVLCYSRFVRIDAEGRRVVRRTYGWDPVASSPIRQDGRPHQRFCSLIRRMDTCEEIYGVMRTDVTRQTRLIGSYTQSDANFLAELALRGEFREIPEPLFYYRLHPYKSTEAYRNRIERMAWFDTAEAGRRCIPFFRQFREYMSLIHRAPLSWAERVRCYIHTAEWSWMYRRWLKSDLESAVFSGMILPFLKRRAPWTSRVWRAYRKMKQRFAQASAKGRGRVSAS